MDSKPLTFRVRAVAFDLDGVLVDSESVNLRSASFAFGELGHALGKDDAARIVGRHPSDYVPVLAERFGLASEAQREIQRIQSECYARLWEREARPVEGAIETLRALERRGYPLALATSAGRGHARRCLERFDLKDLFSVILTKDDVERRKPAPDVYVACARRLRVPPSEMLVVEDSRHGVRAAKACGARCAALLTPHTPADGLAEADILLTSPGELLALLPGC